MSHMSNESNNRSEKIEKYQAESSSADEGNSGVSFSGGSALKKGPWTSAEDAILVDYVKRHGEGNWNAVQKHSGLSRCGKSCRLRWANHLRPNLRKGAFTPEEEQLIIELHAKMGNKWAKIAAQLPGRTDNEIKNYWNTRIKRCQRAGLPLYPPNIYFQVLNENQSRSGSEFSVGDEQNNEHLQLNSYDIPDVIFDDFKASQDLSCMPPLGVTFISSMLNQGLGSENYGFTPPTLNCFKQLPGSETLFSSFNGNATCGLPALEQFCSSEKIHWPLGMGFPYDPDPGSKTLASMTDLVSGSHALSNGNSSTSQTLPVAEKLELPSLQYPKTELSSWLKCPPPPPEPVDAYVESPLAVSVQSGSTYPRNSGLLEALLHEAQVMSAGKNKLSEKSSNSSTMIASEDPVSPVRHSAASVSAACIPPTGGSDLDESSTCEKPTDWFPSENQATFNDSVANLVGEDMCSEYQNAPAGPSSALTRGLGEMKNGPWSFVRPVCQMSELNLRLSLWLLFFHITLPWLVLLDLLPP